MGLLDALSSDDAKLGIALLSASGYSPTPMSFGQRLGGALGQYNADRTATAEHALKNKLLQSQIDENASQNLLRQGQLERQKRQDAYYMGGGVVAPMTAPGGAPGAAGGGVAPGSALGATASTPAPAQGKFAEWSQKYGIPVDALMTDYMSNGGKGIADMLMKRGTPDMQVSGNYAYDKNKVQPGYLPSLNISQDGKASMVQIGPDGLPVVSAPRGAVDTFGAYQGQAANFKPIKVYNPENGREEYTSEGAVVGGRPLTPMAGRPGNVQSPGYSGGDRNAANAESIRIMQAELQKPDLTTSDRAGITREIQRMQMQSGITNAQVTPAAPASGNFAAGPSMREQTTAKFNDKMATEQGDLLTKSYTAANDASNALAGIRESRKSVQAGAYQGTGADFKLGVMKFGQALGVNIDPEKVANTDYLKSTLGNSLLEKAKTLGSNPSNADASRITDIVGSIGKDPQAMSKILDWQEEMSMKAINGHNTRVGQAEGNGFKSQFDMRVPVPEKSADNKPKQTLSELPKNAPKGQRMRDTTTGKILRWNGLQWKEE